MNVSQLSFSGANRTKVATAVSGIFIAAIFILTRLQPDDFLTQMICLFPFGFGSYLIYPIIFPFYTFSVLHYLLIGLIGLVVGLFIHALWIRSRLTRIVLVTVGLLNSCSFTIYVFIQVLRD